MDNLYRSNTSLGTRCLYFFPVDKTVIVVFNPEDEGQLVLYLVDGKELRELTRSPVRYSDYIEYAYTSGDKILFEGRTREKRGYEYYTYSMTQNEWQKHTNLFMGVQDNMMWRNRRYSIDKNTITNPEGKTLTLQSYNPFRVYAFDALINMYIYSYTDSPSSLPENRREWHLWTDRSGEWESIGSYDRELSYITVSDNAACTVWGTAGGCHLAFLRDGQWIEVALLHAELEGGGPGTNMDPMREHYGDNGMSLAVINDSDGYVNVRANPSINAPVIAIILEDVTFMYETIPGNSAWVKVLLPSGTEGYMSSSRLTHVEEEPPIYYDFDDDWIDEAPNSPISYRKGLFHIGFMASTGTL